MDEPLDLLPPLVPHNSSVRLVLVLRPCYSWRLKVAVVATVRRVDRARLAMDWGLIVDEETSNQSRATSLKPF
jgi:hypothetical protein